MTTDSSHTTCCIVGGGPAGIMAGYLLARSGVPVVVLEKHKDFFRDFRGDTVHPSTLELFYELGLLDEFLTIPHQEMPTVGGNFGGYTFTAADFRHLPTRCKFIALMPQWDLLNFIAEQGRKFPAFNLRMEHEATNLITQNNCVIGIGAQTPSGTVRITADLVIGCDGRHSVTRQAANMQVIEMGVPIDVLWFHIGRKATDPEAALGNLNYGKALVLINRSEYFQAGLIIRKGSFDRIRADGLEAFQRSIAELAPFLGDRVSEVTDWDQVKLLSVQINRLEKWHQPGLLCIGDAAHAMSPAGGVGINLAVQDAVATANTLAKPLREGMVTEELLARIQERREFPVRVTQRFQVAAHHGLESVIFSDPGPFHAPWQLKFAVHIPGIQRLVARGIGMGVRPEHIQLKPQS
ncbi:MAG TPA: FAD-dependent oxidoreductase [Acidobacteriaceae bacterium]|nr:FAD-dependent oxidoreductase [Acidobacteriaceae bacterium]